MPTTTTIRTRPCNYCTLPVEEDYDAETGQTFMPEFHWGCRWEAPEGRFAVITVQNAAPVGSVHHTHVRRYTTRKRAVESALELRRWNRRDWKCGAQLDITVAEVLS